MFPEVPCTPEELRESWHAMWSSPASRGSEDVLLSPASRWSLEAKDTGGWTLRAKAMPRPSTHCMLG